MTPRRRPIAMLVAAGIVFLVLMGLGVWQMQRLAWKNDLIARVDARVAAEPVPAPPPAEWAGLTRDVAEYRRVTVSGRYAPDSDVLVQAVTERGSGFWVMTPLETDGGWTVLVNRGFVAADRREDRPLPAGDQSVTGLLRMTQPDGAFLRANDPAAGRWYSRDTQAIAATLGLSGAAPYFIDADRAGEEQPVGGLTVISFRNHHLSYALTWFAMAAGLVLLTGYALRR
ncbi:SURF1 family protein [Paracoccus benzoatiresistens]|uniref:SURF1-like protein n=1 Tax=Paracoccus benzoatiresistens TaxID=2997341 RepID=A0ABT4IZZ9_9RHOB|nr:SURF1 family protein [Paracoccus sp. EF6]MCZ0960449.1 SURF1 family protein [Paracoccus sp. EF6]